MSNKGIEEIPEKKVNLLNMSERQALLYFQHGGGDEDGKQKNAMPFLTTINIFSTKRSNSKPQ